MTEADATRAKVAEFLDGEGHLLARVELQGGAEGWRIEVDESVDLSQARAMLFFAGDGEYLGFIKGDRIRVAA